MNMIDSMLEGSKPEAVEVSDLRKTYGKVIALDGVDLVVTAGTIFGLVGPNGAGKTTLIKALVGALRPTAGAVRVLGLDPLRDKWDLRRQIGYMPQSLALYEDLSARDNILFFSGVHPVDDLPAKVTRILSFTELEDRADDRVATFSGGMKKRISLACALVHEPRTIFLDEPTAAVDPHLRFKMWQFFRRLAGQGTTLVISTHLMDEALLCDRVAVLRRGLIIAATPVALATSLLPYGLSPEVDSLVLDFDSLEDVILDIIQTRGEE